VKAKATCEQVNDLSGVRAGSRRSLPIALSVFTYGVSFGVLARQAGLSLVESCLMSSLVFAGASQFVALSLWHSPLLIATIIFTTLVVNLRHILMSAALSRSIFAHKCSQKLPASTTDLGVFVSTGVNSGSCLSVEA